MAAAVAAEMAAEMAAAEKAAAEMEAAEASKEATDDAAVGETMESSAAAPQLPPAVVGTAGGPGWSSLEVAGLGGGWMRRPRALAARLATPELSQSPEVAHAAPVASEVGDEARALPAQVGSRAASPCPPTEAADDETQSMDDDQSPAEGSEEVAMVLF